MPGRFWGYKKERIPHCSVVILAAGTSQRMGQDKVFMNLEGKPVLSYSLSCFQNSSFVDEIVLVAQESCLTSVADMCKQYGITKVKSIVSGGMTRAESSLIGVSSIASDAKVIAIHDGARPFVSEELLVSLLHAVQEHKAAIPGLRISDSVKLTDSNRIVRTDIDRSLLYRVQTPQVFDADLIKGALSIALRNNLSITDDASAVEYIGLMPIVIDGDPDNIKLTVQQDVAYALQILQKRGSVSL